jgi:hypothetical protein
MNGRERPDSQTEEKAAEGKEENKEEKKKKKKKKKTPTAFPKEEKDTHGLSKSN